MIDRSLDLAGRVAIVTGAARGQGRSHAVALADAGVAVVACDVPEAMASLTYPLATAEDLAATARLVEQRGAKCLPLHLDVREPGFMDRAVDLAISSFGSVDILVANAAVVFTRPLWETDDEAWDEVVATNLTGVFRGLRAVIPHMRERQFGRIVVTSSMGGRMGIQNLSAYNATKWGVIGLAKSLALEVAASGVTVNVVAPCTVATPMVLNRASFQLFAPDMEDPTVHQVRDRFKRVNPIPEPWLEAEDVTRAVMYLVSDPGVITGSVLEVGLGTSARIH